MKPLKERIMRAIELYVNEPDVGVIRAVPDPEVLAEFIEAEIEQDI